jgi:uncharacterized protein YjbI with pentapeptide repeats
MPLAKIEARLRAASEWLRRSKSVKTATSIAQLLGKLTIMVAILSFIFEAPERAKQRHYQAWQLINGARMSPGEAGRSIAIRVLVDDHVEMIDIDLTGGNFRGKNFQAADMPGVNFTNAKIDGANFSCKAGIFVNEYWFPAYSFCWITNLEGARFATESITGTYFDNANLKDAVLGGSSAGLTIVEGSSFLKADMRGITLQDTRLSNNVFSYAKLQNSRWLGGTIANKNMFVGANLQNARWYGLDLGDGKATDFTDADLSGIRVSDQIVPFQDDELREDDKRLHAAKLCRTKFSGRVSNRNCP